MRVHRLIHVFDAPDLAAESGFWAALLDGTVEAEDDWHSVVVDGEWRMGFQLAPDHVPPVWPGGPQQQQIHLDVWVDDLAEAHERAMGLGARLLQAAPDPATTGEVFQVYADPAGHPFCLCRGPLPASEAAGS
ncbi:VOC family protein [Cellulomonas sp. ES6]|uniref:VOC family protein n=1 Tax=Cellulomonas sp. ES6 TaxID=3039384 RepID=UPI0024B6658E|nr:VOC family protein [Cellulomonas sp. ES6]WHP17339.1 VOC family protein [Cellulomonas sp. ES6]